MTDQKKAGEKWIAERREAIRRLGEPQRPPLRDSDYFLGDEAYYHEVSKLYHQQHPTAENTVAQTPAEIKIKVRSDAEIRRLRAFAIDSAARVFAGDPMPPQPGHQAEDIVAMAQKFMEYIETGEA